MIPKLLDRPEPSHLFTVYPASILIFLLFIFLVALVLVLVTCKSAAKASIVFGILSLLFQLLGIWKDSLFDYDYADFGVLGFSPLVAGIAIILSSLAISRTKQNVNIKERRTALAGIIIGVLSFVLTLGYTAWIINTHPI